MAGSLSKSLTHPPCHHVMKKYNEQEDSKLAAEKQGIVAILGPSDAERRKASSLRRTLSADMSSKKWLAHHGFSPMKKIASSEELSLSAAAIRDNTSSSSSEDEDHYQERKAAKFHIWSSIGEEDRSQKPEKQKSELDIWSSIVKGKEGKEDKSVNSAPYVHPLVRKQSSSLTKKSLEVCTESLGSETGSEGFSSYTLSETGDMEAVEKVQEEETAVLKIQEQKKREKEVAAAGTGFYGEEFRVVKYNAAASKKLPPARSFPPPLPSLSGSDGGSVRMRTHRDNGRLVLEAVSMPSPNYFRAQREGGRLVLTFLTNEVVGSGDVVNGEEESREEEFEEKYVNFEEGEEDDEKDGEKSEEEGEEMEEEEEAKEYGIKEMEMVMEEAPKVLTSRVTDVHRLALMMRKPIGLPNKAHGWANKFNEVVKYGGDEEEEVMEIVEPISPLAKSLPPRPRRLARLIPKPPAATKRAVAATSFNAYEYYWRAKPTTMATVPGRLTSQSLKSNSFMRSSKNEMANEQQLQMVALRGNKEDHLAPFSKGCKEPRRSLLFWEPYCIATT